MWVEQAAPAYLKVYGKKLLEVSWMVKIWEYSKTVVILTKMSAQQKIKTSPTTPPNYSFRASISEIESSTSHSIAIPASRSIRFAASAAKFWIWRCLSCPEKQFHQIIWIFHNLSIFVNFNRLWWSGSNSSSCFHAGGWLEIDRGAPGESNCTRMNRMWKILHHVTVQDYG